MEGNNKCKLIIRKIRKIGSKVKEQGLWAAGMRLESWVNGIKEAIPVLNCHLGLVEVKSMCRK